MDADLVEAVVLLPDNLFYNTPSAGLIVVINHRKRHLGEILLVNASKLFTKGRPKNFLRDDQADDIVAVYRDWKAVSELPALITLGDAEKNDYSLSPSRYVGAKPEVGVLPLDEAVVRFREAEEERIEADKKLNIVLAALGFKG